MSTTEDDPISDDPLPMMHAAIVALTGKVDELSAQVEGLAALIPSMDGEIDRLTEQVRVLQGARR